MSLRARKSLALLILVVGIPLYIVVAVNVIDWATLKWGRLPILAEVAVFCGLGVLWAFPLRKVFLGIGQGQEPPK